MFETAHVRKIVSIFDQALDRDAMGAKGLALYATLRDDQHLRILPGKTPAVFHIKPPSVSLYNGFIAPIEDERLRAQRAFQLCVIQIDNLIDWNGQHCPMLLPGRRPFNGKEIPYWDDEQLERVPPALIEDAGTVAAVLGFFGPFRGGGYPLPPSWRLALEVLSRRSAADHLSAQPESNSDQAAPLGTAPSVSGGEPTAATAPEKSGPLGS